MTIQDMSSIGGLFAALATIAALVYLALQIRHNTKALQGSTLHSVTLTQQAELKWGSYIADAFTKAIEDPDKLNSIEAWKMSNWLMSVMAARQNEYAQFRRGLLDIELWEASQGMIRIMLSLPWARNWWMEYGRFSFTREFVQMVDQISEFKSLLIDFDCVLAALKKGIRTQEN